jgi:hypothetical protein
MHARKVLKNIDLIFRNIEQNIFLSIADIHEQLIGDWLFTLILKLKQYLHLLIINLFCCSCLKHFNLGPDGFGTIEKLILRTSLKIKLSFFLIRPHAIR